MIRYYDKNGDLITESNIFSESIFSYDGESFEILYHESPYITLSNQDLKSMLKILENWSE